MPRMSADQQEKSLAPLQDCNIKNTSPTQYTNIDSAVDMTFPEAVEKDLAEFEKSNNESKMNSHKIGRPSVSRSINCCAANSNFTINSGSPDTTRMSVSVVNGMPYSFEYLMEMGNALAKARRERAFPTTITPTYNLQAIINDYNDLQRLNIVREAESDTRDHAFRPDISRLYIEIQRKIQDRDLTQGEVAAESNVRARLSGFANSTGAETGMYNLMRHAMNSVLRLNNLTLDSDSNIVDAVASRVVKDIRATVKSQADCGANGVTGQNMDAVMEGVFSAIQDTLSQGVGTQAKRLDGQINNMSNIMSNITTAQDAQINDMSNIMSNITTAQDAQVNAIAGHVSAIDNHVHAMGNNVNAMSSLVNSTNGNVTALTTNIGSLQTIVSMLPQMVGDSVREMIPSMIKPAVEQAFERAISNELVARLQVFTNAVQEARARAEVISNPHYRTHEKTKRRGWFSIFKKGSNRHSRRTGATY
ncbi:hypothetical protein F4782DRAFT_546009 [Xylaria castorea]|nr:hypothetical protein F4782DRAFT_546009 [Xylaria castorea]